MHASTPATTGIYERLGVAPVINARGNNTVLGGSTPSSRVRAAMQEAEHSYVDMQQLLERSGEAIAALLGCEAAYVTPGAAAALALGAAACMAGSDPDKIGRLPDTTGLKDIVLIQAGHRYHYERAVTVPGARLVEVAGEAATFEAALGPRVAAVLFPAHLDEAPDTLPLDQVLSIAHAKGVPVLVDAAGRVYPIERLLGYTRAGADLVAYGAKYLGALNASGILCGRKELVSAAAVHGFIGFETVAWGKSFGRPLKLDRQTIVAVVTALQEWLETDHAARLAGYERRLQAMARALADLGGVTASTAQADGPSPRLLRLLIDATRAPRDAASVAAELYAGVPAIAVGRDADQAITINPVTLREEEDGIVIARLRELLM
jgi:D-glucosaminate-6-phosphate ammonia-lyase